MAKITTYRCDGCGIFRENDTNHWFAFYENGGSASWTIRPLLDDDASNQVVCGLECALKFFNDFVQKTVKMR